MIVPGIVAAAIQAAAGGGSEAWFETVLWTGAGGASHAHSSLDLSDGGLVWVRARSASGVNQLYFKAESGATVYTFSFADTTEASTSSAVLDETGFEVPHDSSGTTYVAWVFKPIAGLFEILRITSTSTAAPSRSAM